MNLSIQSSRPCAVGQGTARARRGSALFAVVPAVVLMLALFMAFVGTMTSSSQSANQNRALVDAESAARAVVSLAVESVWTEFGNRFAVESAQPWDFQLFLTELGLPEQSGAATPKGVPIMARLALQVDNLGRSSFAGAVVEELTAYRLDNWDSTALVIEATVALERGNEQSSRTMRHSVREVFTIAPPAWEGLDYAILATNVNCILCHTEIDSAQRFYNTDPALFGTFDEVKLGTIESLHFRSNPDSSIAGSLYVGGEALEGDGTPITDWAGFSLKSALVDSERKLAEDDWGNLNVANLQPPDPNDASVLANLFLGGDAHTADSFLPLSFPSPFPDNGGFDPVTGTPIASQARNRIVDDEEFSATVGGSTGSVAGGRISVLDPSAKVDTSAELSSLRNGQGVAVSGVVAGNAYLHGEKNDPLLIHGDVAFDGDLVISGFVQGAGTIRARGNVYIPADLYYADGAVGADRTYGKAPNGSPNNLAIAAGGNIIVGDYYRPAWGKGSPATGGKDGSFNFVMEEVAIFNRMEWLKTQPSLPGKTVQVQTGTKIVMKDEYRVEYYVVVQDVFKTVKTGNKISRPVYKNVKTTTGVKPYQTTTTTKVQTGTKLVDETVKVKTGTKTVTKSRNVKTGVQYPTVQPVMEWQTASHPNPHYKGSDYLARYYTFDEGKVAPIFNKQGYYDPATSSWHSDERAEKWDDSKLSYADESNVLDPYIYNADGSRKAVVSSLSPSAGWIDGARMQKLIDLNLAQRDARKDPLEINATLYSANSIMGVVGNLGSDKTDGRLQINGGVVAADLGLLAANGTRINFDGRGASRLSITSDQGLTIRRSASLPRPRS